MKPDPEDEDWWEQDEPAEVEEFEDDFNDDITDGA